MKKAKLIIWTVAAGFKLLQMLKPQSWFTKKEERNYNDVKQVIVMRTKYPDGNGGTMKLRTGKLIAQGSHASMAFLVKKASTNQSLSDEEHFWIYDSFKKICLYVETENELLDLYQKAKDAKLTVELITDSGKTEFHGIPTNTCLAIGPHESNLIDPLTKNLPLL